MGYRRSTVTYGTYGSVAYAPAYDAAAVSIPRQQEEYRQRREVKNWEREEALTRTRVQVREAGMVAPFAVVGFLAVAALAFLMMFSYVQLTVANGEMASLRTRLSELQAENATLTAEYEKVFDMATIENAVGGTMVRPTSDQVVYIDLSAPDSVEIYGAEKTYLGPVGALRSAGEALGEIYEYFR